MPIEEIAIGISLHSLIVMLSHGLGGGGGKVGIILASVVQ